MYKGFPAITVNVQKQPNKQKTKMIIINNKIK